MEKSFVIGGNGSVQVSFDLRMANRHGLISGATGTGKTVTLQVLAEGFSRAGVPVFMTDVKGDLSGVAVSGQQNEKIAARIQQIGIHDYRNCASPVAFWDLYGKQGHPVRVTISDFGPLLLANYFDLNDTQTALLFAAFKIADSAGMLMLDLKDLQAMLNWMKSEKKQLAAEYGGISDASIAAIQRRLMMLEQNGGNQFFGEPALDFSHMMQTTLEGRGVINLLDATALIREPGLYSIFLLWLMAELFESLPEVGDAGKPRMVFFFDEAHLLFRDTPQLLLDKIEQVVRLIRSKGVGIYFVTQTPADIPESILGQLGNRIQHALRAYTPRDQKAVRVAAQTFRANPAFSTETAITSLATGEALVSVLDSQGVPTPVERVLVAPPASRIGPLTQEERAAIVSRSPYEAIYRTALDRHSAYEELAHKVARQVDESQQRARERIEREIAEREQAARVQAQRPAPRKAASRKDSAMDAFTKSAVRAVGSSLGRQIVRGLLGSLLGGKR